MICLSLRRLSHKCVKNSHYLSSNIWPKTNLIAVNKSIIFEKFCVSYQSLPAIKCQPVIDNTIMSSEYIFTNDTPGIQTFLFKQYLKYI
jgi:hypothetical protein